MFFEKKKNEETSNLIVYIRSCYMDICGCPFSRLLGCFQVSHSGCIDFRSENFNWQAAESSVDLFLSHIC